MSEQSDRPEGEEEEPEVAHTEHWQEQQEAKAREAKKDEPDPAGAAVAMATPKFASTEIREQDKLQLVLAYLGLLSLIPYLTVKDSAYVRFHARQGLALAILGIACWGIFLIPFVGVLGGLALVGVLVLSVLGIVKAFEGARWRMPIAADVADRLNL